MARWVLEYYLGTRDRPRSVETDLDDIVGEGIEAAHAFVRKVSDGEGTLTSAHLPEEPFEGDPLDGEPRIPLWVTVVPFWPEDPDDGKELPKERLRLEIPARHFETRVDPDGGVVHNGPTLGLVSLAVRRHFGDGREGTVLRIHREEPD